MYISLRYVFADHPVIPEVHNNAKPYDLRPEVFKRYSNIYLADTNNFTKLITNFSGRLLKKH